MEEAIRLRLIEATENHLAYCESEISALAHEALCPSTSAARRAEVLILRAKMQSKSVSLSQQLQKLQSEAETVHSVDRGAGEPSGVHDCASPKNSRRKWPWANDLFRAS